MLYTKEEILRTLDSYKSNNKECTNGSELCDLCKMQLMAATDPEFIKIWHEFIIRSTDHGPYLTLASLFINGLQVGEALAEARILRSMYSMEPR